MDEAVRESEERTRITSVYACARCGKDHERVEFRKFRSPPHGFWGWGTCPETGEPILLRYLSQE